MIEAKRTCEKCKEVIPDPKGFLRVSMELLMLNGTGNTASAFTGADFCSQGCLLARVKEMLSSDAAVLQDAARKVSEAA